MSEPSTGMMVTSNVRLVRPLGEGGMGSVWVAEHLSLRTRVVVKFMSRALAGSSEAIARFSREAAAASQVKSPHVVQMLDHGVGTTGAPYIVMELLEGRDLESHLGAARVLGAREVTAISAQLARALSKAHERGIVHRDIKPSNVFLLDAGADDVFVKLLDFGIAKGSETAIVGNTTRTGAFVGSPFYMSPEQVVGAKSIDFRSDLWSFGVVVYEMLTGKKPFYADNVGALVLRIHRDPLPVPSKENPSLPGAFDSWFMRACAREPDERFASAKQMAETLGVALAGEVVPLVLRVESGSSRAVSIDTNGGAGPVASGPVPPVSRGRGWLIAGIAAAAVGAGFAVPKLMRASSRATTPLASAPSVARVIPAQASGSISSSSTAPVAIASSIVLLAPGASTPAPSASAHSAVLAQALSRALLPHAPLPRVSSAASVLPSANPPPVASSDPATAATIAHGSDDDIK